MYELLLIIIKCRNNISDSTRIPGPTKNGFKYPSPYLDRRPNEAFSSNPSQICPNDLRSIAVPPPPHSQSARFTRIAYASGIFFFVALLKFPVIRVQPGFKRFGISGAISYPIYNYINSIAD